MIINSRRIFKTKTTSQFEVSELLSFIFIGEILKPSKTLWLVSPWVSDVVILDNRSGEFSSLDPSWGRKQIRLSEILFKLMSLGVTVKIVTKKDEEHSEKFIEMIENIVNNYGFHKYFNRLFREKLHIKGILTDSNQLTGSMNITYNGLTINDEEVFFETSPEKIAETRLFFNNEYDCEGYSE